MYSAVHVLFFRLFLLLGDFNMFDVPYSWHVSGASRPLSFVWNKKICCGQVSVYQKSWVLSKQMNGSMFFGTWATLGVFLQRLGYSNISKNCILLSGTFSHSELRRFFCFFFDTTRCQQNSTVDILFIALRVHTGLLHVCWSWHGTSHVLPPATVEHLVTINAITVYKAAELIDRVYRRKCW